VPLVSGIAQPPPDLVGKVLAELERPLPHALVADDDAARGQHLLDHAQAEGKAEIQPNRMADDLGGKAIAGVAGANWRRHRVQLPALLPICKPAAAKLTVPSLVPYAAAAGLLADVLPVASGANANTLREHTLRVAERAEAELGEEQSCFIEGCPAQWAALPIPEGRIVVGLDGGYVRDWKDRKTNFEIIVGQSVPEERDARCIGLVHTYDEKPKRRLFDLLRSQGLQPNQDVTFLTDGGEEVRALTELVTPQSEHVLDWFHITMRLTVLCQYARGVAHHDDAASERLLADLERIKWFLWHGNQYRAGQIIESFLIDVDDLEVDYPNVGKFGRASHEFAVYIASNVGSLINYGERFRTGERISSCLAESTVNAVISKRFAKRQQMQWTKRGAHLLLQTRTRALDGTLRPLFEKWYPGLANDNSAEAAQVAAA